MINTKRLVNTFINFVKIDSESGNEKKFANHLLEFGKSLNLKVSIDSYNNIYLESTGVGEPLMLNTHMDTVVPGKDINPKVNGDYIESDGSTILGADPKASIAAMFEMVQIYNETNLPHRPFVLTFTCNEETGIPTAQHIKHSVKECIVPDRGTPLGEIMIEAPFAQVFQVTVNGKTAYATTEFSKGKHAILAACQMISNLPVGDFAKDATSNIGIISGGQMTTTVPDKCTFKGNCYCFDQADLEYFTRKLEETIKKVDQDFGTQSKIEYLEYFPGYKVDENSKIVEIAKKAIKQAGLKPGIKRYKAVSNANLLNSIGIKSILISYGAENQHSLNERISIHTLEKLTEVLINLTGV